MKTMSFFVPIKELSDWRKFLGDPQKHWKTGRSAKSCAEIWWNASGFPEAIKTVFTTSKIDLFRDLEFIMGFPEYQVQLPPTSGHPSQNNLWVIAKSPKMNQLVSISIEAKVDEPFDQIVGEWIKEETTGKKERLRYICDQLDLDESETHSIRYQLMHRTVSALIMAEKLGTRNALMMVQSFDAKRSGYEDYQEFSKLLGTEPDINKIVKTKPFSGKNLYLAWVECRKIT